MDTITCVLRLLLIIGLCIKTGSSLKCYTCDANNNAVCSREEDVTDCDAISTAITKYDTCQTKLTKSPETGVHIIKKCTVGPCSLDPEQGVALNMQCDRSGSIWNCEECCNTDTCNISAAPSMPHSTWPILMAAAILAALLTQKGQLLNL